MTDDAGDGMDAPQLGEAVALLAGFLGAEPLTAAIVSLERDLAGRPAREVGDMAATRGISPELMVAALTDLCHVLPPMVAAALVR